MLASCRHRRPVGEARASRLRQSRRITSGSIYPEASRRHNAGGRRGAGDPVSTASLNEGAGPSAPSPRRVSARCIVATAVIQSALESMAANPPGDRVREGRKVREIAVSGTQLVLVSVAAAVVLVLPFFRGVQVGLVRLATSVGGFVPTRGSGTPNTDAVPSGQGPPAVRPPSPGAPANPRLGVEHDAQVPPSNPAPPATGPAQVSASPSPAAPPPSTPRTPSVMSAALPTVAPSATTGTSAPSVDAAPVGPAGPVLTIQVMASAVRAEADAMAQALVGKGYEAYVLAPASGAAQPMFRVRVGKFRERSEANTVLARLAGEEHLETWLVRLPSR